MPRDGFDVMRTLCRVADRKPQLGHRLIEATVEIHERVCGPQLLAQLFPRYQFAGALQQKGENLKRLFLQFYSNAALPQLTGSQVNLENPETASLAATLSRLHRTPPLGWKAA
jgi:hypothetical protein